MTGPFRLEVLSREHDRSGFFSGEAALDRYFQTQVTQDARRRIANCFVAIAQDSGTVAAFYTIAAAGLPFQDLPAAEAQRLPRYPTLPAVRIGRLAVDRRYAGRGLGAALLADAARRVMQAPPAVFALLVDAKNEAAVGFYEHHGFQRLASAPMTLFLPLATAEKTLLGSH
jgi:ribosomal protein S18 acetylase RimI-like enzyme